MAMLLPDVTVHAFDTSPIARRRCRAMAESNGVADRVRIDAFCDPDRLCALPLGSRALIMSDCEGYEKELFTERRRPPPAMTY